MIGRVISHYKILKKVGEGGMGVVYLAEDIKLGRKVAMKILTQKLTERNGARERFKREAKTAASVNHPNIVTVHEIDEYEDLIYIVMEYVEGETLDRKIKIKGEDAGEKTTPLETLKTDDIINIILEVCEGLEIAHQAGIVHRDIKLENILINREGRVKILDFGLAKLKGASKLTGDSVALGTAFYMSPEQLKGEEFDHRIDIWSLGVMMYVMTTGELPFVGDTAMEIIYSIMKTEPEPIFKLNKKVPPGLRRIISRCLRKNPEKRFPDIAALVIDLNQVKESLVTGKSDFTWKITSVVDTFRGKFWRIIVPAAVAILTIAALLLIPSTSIPIRKFLGLNILPREKRVAVLPLNVDGIGTPDQQAFSLGLTDNLSRRLIRLEKYDRNLLIISTNKLYRDDITSPEAARKKYPVNLAIRGSISWDGDFFSTVVSLVDINNEVKLYSWKMTKHKSDIIDFRDELTAKIAGVMEIDLNPKRKDYLNIGCTHIAGPYEDYLKALGHLAYLLNRKKADHIERAIKLSMDPYHISPAIKLLMAAYHIETTIKLLKEAVQVDSNYALAYAGLAEAFLKKYDLTKDKKWAEKAIYYLQIAKEKDNRLECVYIILGKIYSKKEKYREALYAFRQALQIDPHNYEAYFLSAKIHEKKRDLEEVENIYQEAIRQRPSDYAVQNNLGLFYYHQGRYKEALEPLERVVKLNPNYFAAVINLGAVYFALNRRDEAKRMFTHSLSIKTNYVALANLGTLYFYEGLYDLAIAMFEDALDLYDRHFLIWGYLAESCYWDDPENTVRFQEHFKKAKELAKKENFKNPGNPEVLAELAFYHVRLDEYTKAVSILDEMTAPGKLSARVMSTMANGYEQMGDREKALKWIESSLERGLTMAEINNYPGLSELRSDPSFREILKKVKEKDKEGESLNNKK